MSYDGGASEQSSSLLFCSKNSLLQQIMSKSTPKIKIKCFFRSLVLGNATLQKR